VLRDSKDLVNRYLRGIIYRFKSIAIGRYHVTTNINIAKILKFQETCLQYSSHSASETNRLIGFIVHQCRCTKVEPHL